MHTELLRLGLQLLVRLMQVLVVVWLRRQLLLLQLLPQQLLRVQVLLVLLLRVRRLLQLLQLRMLRLRCGLHVRQLLVMLVLQLMLRCWS